MEYNSQKEHLVIKEYGRHVQNLIAYALTIEDREQRTEFAKGMVKLIAQISPNIRQQDDFQRKLWDHLFLIADFKLDVDAPFPRPEGEEDVLPKVHTKLPYPGGEMKFKHYGKNVETMVEKALKMEDKEKQMEFALCIGNYMKLVYATWNRDNVNDIIIRTDLEHLSGGVLKLPENADLDSLTRNNRGGGPRQEVHTSSRNRNRNRNNRGNRNRNRRGGGGGGGGRNRGRHHNN
jgi:hypothetical protein